MAMTTTKAWHLRQDGQAFPVNVHLYAMHDDDLASEAEVASFLIKTDSKDQELAKFVLDAWMAMLIEDKVSYDADKDEINEELRHVLSRLPYRFPYALSIDELIDIHIECDHYNNVDELYEFIDSIRANLFDVQKSIEHSINQQFCRVRFGGKYNSTSGDGGIWFRISSTNYNWANTIYIFVIEMRRKLGISNVNICRDPESDNGYASSTDDYFYKAKDGAVYYQMDINEYLQEEHEHSPVFNSTDLGVGIIATIRNQLRNGEPLNTILSNILVDSKNVSASLQPERLWRNFVRREIENEYIASSEWSDGLNTRTGGKINKVKRMISEEFPEIEVADIDYRPRANSRGNMVGFELIITLKSQLDELDGLNINIASNKELGAVLAETIVRLFRIEYRDYLKYQNISV